jgi:teichuronic acid biosynthesis glycosyltransferase TuaC
VKVLVFTSLYPNNVWLNHGVFVKERMTHVARLDGCQVKVVAPVPYHPRLKITHRWRFSQVHRWEVRDGLEVYHPRYVMLPKVGMTLYGMQMFLSVLPTVKKIRHDFDFDLIDAHYVYPDGFAAVLLGRMLGKPVVVSARGSDINLYAELPLIRRLLRYTLQRSDKLIAVCLALKEAMMRLGIPAEKIAVVPNGVDLEKFSPIPKDQARRRLGLSQEKKIILSVGGLIPRKGFDLLIKALRMVIDEYPGRDLQLVIVGEGTHRKALESLVYALGLEKSVYLPGAVGHQEISLWYSAADLFCLASSREGWPNVLLEALACGTPVVATAVWGVPEIIRSDGIGLLTDRHERAIAATIACALQRSWNSTVLRRYAEGHTWNRVARSVVCTFESAIESHRSWKPSLPRRLMVPASSSHAPPSRGTPHSSG